MAERTIAGQLWPEGTTVGAYLAAAWTDPAREPSGPAIDTDTVSGGSVTFTGLAEDVHYVAYASPRGVRFLVSSVSQQPQERARTDRERLAELEDAIDDVSQGGGGVGMGALVYDGSAWPERPALAENVMWIGPVAPIIGGAGNAVNGDVWVDTS